MTDASSPRPPTSGPPDLAEQAHVFLSRLRHSRPPRADSGTAHPFLAGRDEGRGPREWRAQFRALHLLADHGPLTMQQLAQRLDVTPPTVTGIVKRLAEQELVERERDEDDSRVSWISISETGRAAVQAVHEDRRRAMEALFQQYTPEEQIEISRAIRIVERVLVDKAAPLLVDGEIVVSEPADDHCHGRHRR